MYASSVIIQSILASRLSDHKLDQLIDRFLDCLNLARQRRRFAGRNARRIDGSRYTASQSEGSLGRHKDVGHILESKRVIAAKFTTRCESDLPCLRLGAEDVTQAGEAPYRQPV
jgi:hypothetical protein